MNNVIYVDFRSRRRYPSKLNWRALEYARSGRDPYSDSVSYALDAVSYLTGDTFQKYLCDPQTGEPLFSEELCRAFIQGYNDTMKRLEGKDDDDTNGY